MISTPLPPIYRDIRRLLVLTAKMVRRFARYHKYTVGTDLRTQAMQMMRCVNRACFDAAPTSSACAGLVLMRKPDRLAASRSAVQVWFSPNAAVS
jgi:hypothetical protein